MAELNKNKIKINSNEIGRNYSSRLTRPSENAIQISEERDEEKSESESLLISNNSKLTDFQAAINLMKGIFGSGIFSMGFIFYKNGIINSTLIVLAIGGFSHLSTYLFVKLSDKYFVDTSHSLTELLTISTTKINSYIFHFFLFNLQFGKCVADLIFFVNVFEVIFLQLFHHKLKIVCILISLVFVLPSTIRNQWTFFYHYSLCGNMFVFLSLILITIFGFIKFGFDSSKINIHLFFGEKNFLEAFGLIYFKFSILGNSFSIRKSMKIPQNFIKIFKKVIIFECCILILFSCIFVLVIHEKLKPNILMSFFINGSVSYFFYFISVIYAICSVLSFPLSFTTCVSLVETQKYFKNVSTIFVYIFRFTILFFIIILVYIVPSYLYTAKVFGILTGIFVQFLYPIYFYLVAFKNELNIWRIVSLICVFIIIFITGLVGFFSYFLKTFKL